MTEPKRINWRRLLLAALAVALMAGYFHRPKMDAAKIKRVNVESHVEFDGIYPGRMLTDPGEIKAFAHMMNTMPLFPLPYNSLSSPGSMYISCYGEGGDIGGYRGRDGIAISGSRLRWNNRCYQMDDSGIRLLRFFTMNGESYTPDPNFSYIFKKTVTTKAPHG